MEREIKIPMPGVKVWKNPKNKFCVVEIHYTADPAKRTKEWKAEASSKMSKRKWNQEYELSWETWFGLPVYSDFSEQRHGVVGEIDPHIGLPLLRGWDFGLTPAAVIAQLQGDTLCVMREFIGLNIGAKRFSSIVMKQCRVFYPNWSEKRDWIDVIDPSGFARKDTDETTCAKVLQDCKLEPLAGLIAFEARRQAVENFLTRHAGGQECFQISLSNCPVLVQGFKGGYQYPEKNVSIEPGTLMPIKNEYSHPHDGLQYIAGKISQLTRRARTQIARPQYSFNRDIR